MQLAFSPTDVCSILIWQGELESMIATTAPAAVLEAVEDTCTALATPMIALVGEARRSRAATRASEAWRVREVAALAVHRVLDACRRAESVECAAAKREELAQLRMMLQDELTRRTAFEPSAAVRTVLRDGGTLGAELNYALSGGAVAADPDEEAAAWAAVEEQ
eukprot:7247885-Prymnesium_polylepis.1